MMVGGNVNHQQTNTENHFISQQQPNKHQNEAK